MGENFHELVKIFAGKLLQIARWCHQKMPRTQILTEKTHKWTQNLRIHKSFSPESFPLYGYM